MTPLDFLKALWENKPEERYILIWTLPDKRSHWFTDVAAAAQFAANVNFLDVYVGVGLAREDHGRRIVASPTRSMASPGSGPNSTCFRPGTTRSSRRASRTRR